MDEEHWHVYTTDGMSFPTTWVDLKSIMLSEIDSDGKGKNHMISLTRGAGLGWGDCRGDREHRLLLPCHRVTELKGLSPCANQRPVKHEQKFAAKKVEVY